MSNHQTSKDLYLKYYVYRHIRLDTGEIFYIGIGHKYDHYTSYRKEYRRAYETHNRNKFWKNIVNKSGGFEVEILYESNDYEFIKNKEKEFINLYKRRLDGGVLCNITLGGEGSQGFKHSEISKKKMSDIKIGKVWHNKTKPVYQYDLEGNFIKKWDRVGLVAKTLNTHPTAIHRCLTGKVKTSNGFIWKR